MLIPSRTPLLVLIDLAIILLIYVLLRKKFWQREEVARKDTYFAMGLIFMFCMFSFWGTDWFHYQNDFWTVRNYPDFKSNLEVVYVFLIRHVFPEYLSFRLTVWGLALIFVYLSVKHLRLDLPLACLFFGMLFMFNFAYGRVSLAVAMMVYGVILVDRPFKYYEKQSVLIGLLLIVCSIFFHKSAIFGVAIALFSFLPLRINRNYWLYILLSFAIIAVAARFLLADFINGAMASDSDSLQQSLNSGMSYMQAEQRNSSFRNYLQAVLERTPYYIAAYISYMLLVEYELPHGIRIVARLNLFLVLFSTVFAMDLGVNTSEVYLRLIQFVFVPSTIVLVYAFSYDLYPRLTRFAFIEGTLCMLYFIVYAFYDCVLNNR